MILMVMALSFSYLMKTEALGTLSFKNSVENKFLAEAGIERAVMEVIYRNLNKGQQTAPDGKEVWRTDGTPHKVETENGYYSVSIIDEGGKVDINKTDYVILKNILLNRGLKQETVDIIIDSIQDWRDPDDLHRLNGAESDYYMSLRNPYKARNADFETLEELLLVKGVTAEILYGDNGKKGLIDLLTINSTSGKVNIASATKELLLAIPGMSSEIADAIISNRNAQPPLPVQDVIGGSYAAMAPYLDAGASNTFTVESAGHKLNDKAGYAIRATITIDAKNKFSYLYYKSPVMIDYVSNNIN
jgi:general secretion pathway protein K